VFNGAADPDGEGAVVVAGAAAHLVEEIRSRSYESSAVTSAVTSVSHASPR
jgi:hypothetical protein